MEQTVIERTFYQEQRISHIRTWPYDAADRIDTHFQQDPYQSADSRRWIRPDRGSMSSGNVAGENREYLSDRPYQRLSYLDSERPTHYWNEEQRREIETASRLPGSRPGYVDNNCRTSEFSRFHTENPRLHVRSPEQLPRIAEPSYSYGLGDLPSQNRDVVNPRDYLLTGSFPVEPRIRPPCQYFPRGSSFQVAPWINVRQKRWSRSSKRKRRRKEQFACKRDVASRSKSSERERSRSIISLVGGNQCAATTVTQEHETVRDDKLPSNECKLTDSGLFSTNDFHDKEIKEQSVTGSLQQNILNQNGDKFATDVDLLCSPPFKRQRGSCSSSLIPEDNDHCLMLNNKEHLEPDTIPGHVSSHEGRDLNVMAADGHQILASHKQQLGLCFENSPHPVLNNVEQFSVVPEEGILKSRRKLLVLDVNGVLADIVKDFSHKFTPDFKLAEKGVFKRPFCDDFLNFCFENFDVGIWSSRNKINLTRTVEFLMMNTKGKLLFCWDKSHCTETGYKKPGNFDKPLVIKELAKLWEKKDRYLPWQRGFYDESNTILLDDSQYKALRNPPFTAVFPRPYSFKNIEDTSLGPNGDIRLYLKQLAEAANVQRFIEANPFW